MTTQEWIYNKIGNEQSEWKYFASVAVDPDGVVYSYGSHYPLAVIINGRGYVNNRGYSVTTSKHIRWAFSALVDRLGRDNVHGVELLNERTTSAWGYKGAKFTAENIKASAKKQIEDIEETMAGKKRKNTQVYKQLENELELARATYNSVKHAKTPPKTDERGDNLKTIGMVMAFGNIFSKTDEEANAWKKRMLDAGVPEGAIHWPEDWDELPEDEKKTRLNKVINEFTK